MCFPVVNWHIYFFHMYIVIFLLQCSQCRKVSVCITRFFIFFYNVKSSRVLFSFGGISGKALAVLRRIGQFASELLLFFSDYSLLFRDQCAMLGWRPKRGNNELAIDPVTEAASLEQTKQKLLYPWNVSRLCLAFPFRQNILAKCVRLRFELWTRLLV